MSKIVINTEVYFRLVELAEQAVPALKDAAWSAKRSSERKEWTALRVSLESALSAVTTNAREIS